MAYSNFYAKFLDVSKTITSSYLAFWHYRSSRFYLAAAFLFQGLSFWQAFWIKNNLSSELIVLRYKIDFGANLVGEPSLILYYPFISLGVLILNSILAIGFSRRNDKKVFIHLFLGAALSFSFFMSLYLLSVFLINFR
jgi:hypothetical protein